MILKNGVFIISLDFELYWGILTKSKVEQKRMEGIIIGGRKVIPELLDLFKKYKIHATWSTVGILFFENKKELLENLPKNRPTYPNIAISPYEHINEIGPDERRDPLHYAPSLIRLILSYPNQEISTHTFSHYDSLAYGQDGRTFESDLEAVIKIAKKYSINIKTIIFPYNKINENYLQICKNFGIKAYRGIQDSWLHSGKNPLIKRLIRFINRYININGHDTFSLEIALGKEPPYNFRASRFLHPYSNKLKFLEWIRLNRILSSMTYAAKNALAYHLWWHPHDFGLDQKNNLLFLEKILKHFVTLNRKYNMKSSNMEDLINEMYE